jgi:hemerythrin-like domain-containing protein
MKCTELVIQDHVVIRRGLDILDGMLTKLEGGERIEIADVSAILKFLQAFGDEYHQAMEETVLFPALMRSAPGGNPIHLMVMEHGEDRALVTRITEALAVRRVVDFVYSSRRLCMLLRKHIDREDGVLSDLASELLSKDEDSMLVAEFRKNRTEPETYLDFSRLERKYTRKVPVNSWTALPETLRRGRAAGR